MEESVKLLKSNNIEISFNAEDTSEEVVYSLFEILLDWLYSHDIIDDYVTIYDE